MDYLFLAANAIATVHLELLHKLRMELVFHVTPLAEHAMSIQVDARVA